MTGWRIGYLAAPLKIAKAAGSMQSHTTSNACSIAQYASTTALTDAKGEAFIDEMQKVFDERRKFMFDYLKDVEGIVFEILGPAPGAGGHAEAGTGTAARL